MSKLYDRVIKYAGEIRQLELTTKILEWTKKQIKELESRDEKLLGLIKKVEKQEGPVGPVGPQGPRGLRGKAGIRGKRGRDGKDGKNGNYFSLNERVSVSL